MKTKTTVRCGFSTTVASQDVRGDSGGPLR